MGSITSLFVRKIVAAAGPRVDQAALLRSIGLDPDGRADVAQMVSDQAYYDLLERIAAETDGAVDLPLKVGGAMRCDDYGALGLAFKTAPTLRASLARSERYARLLTSVATYEIRPDGENAYFVLHRAGPRRLGLRLSNEATLASVTSMIRQVSPTPFAPLEVHFKHPAPERASAHGAYFGGALRFGSELDALLISGAALSRPNRLSDAGLSQFLVRRLDDELSALPDAPRLSEHVLREIAQSLSDGAPKADAIARRLGLSERTLQRRLREEGSSFHQLSEAARRDLAKTLLAEQSYALAEVAFLTGFSEQSAFTRAFKRWTAQTPAAYRAAHGA